MRVLVTGANGFLGGHLVKALLAVNFDVTALVRETSDLDNLTALGCKIVTGDLLKTPSLVKHLEGMDGVFHVAGAMSSSPGECERLLQVNIEGVKNILAACVEKKVKKLIHVSSAVTIGTNLSPLDPLLNEESLNITKNKNFANYDSKRIGEELVLKAAGEGSIDAVVVNPGLIYGGGDARKMIRKGNLLAARGKLPAYTSGGVNVVAVEDVTAAMIKALREGKSGERYLLTGDNITIKELLISISILADAQPPKYKLPDFPLKMLATILEFFGIKSELCKENIFAATSFHWYDNSKAKRDLSFKPKPYKEALKSSVEWMKANRYL